ncbi:MAG: hypothetical protein ACLGHX_09720 [Acidimicrobiia bacterium]
MSAVAIVTLVLVGVLIAALALYLIRVALMLRTVIDTLGKITFGVRAIAHRTEPIAELVTGIHEDVAAMDRALAALLAKKGAGAQEEAS